MTKFSRVNREVVNDFSFFKAVKDTAQVVDDDGSVLETFERNCVSHIGSVAVVPLFANNDVALIRQYRVAIDEDSLEIVAGRRDVNGESPEKTAMRELFEEVAVSTNDLISLGTIYTSPGFLDEEMYLFLANDCFDLEKNEPDGVEEVYSEVVRVPLEHAIEWIKDGTISDAKSIIAIGRTEEILRSKMR
jgi:ADP-ribose pyrophosphatase